MRRYPVAEPDIGELERTHLLSAFDSTWISSTGAYVDQVEGHIRTMAGVAHGIPTANGTVALHLVLAALGIGPGDQVVVPSFTYIATANAVKYCGAEPVFADVDPLTWGLDVQSVGQVLGPRVKAIVAVHLYGHPTDMDPLMEMAKESGVAVVEDAAEAPFARYKGRPVGALGHAASFSFFGNKALTCGEGGAVVTDDDELAGRMRLLRGQGMDPDRRYYFPEIGFNYRLTNLQAAILTAQFERSEELLGRRRDVFDAYDAHLCDSPLTPSPRAEWAQISPWLYTVLASDEDARAHLMSGLAEAGVETRPVFIPIHTLPPYKSAIRTALPVTENLGVRGFSLPTSSLMTHDDVDEICTRLQALVGN